MAGNNAGNMAAKRQWAMSPEFEQTATVAQKFENLYGLGFYRNLTVVLMWRACAYELEKDEGLTDAEKQMLAEVRAELDALLTRNLTYLEENLNYQSIPIQKLVRIQLASGLLYAQYAHRKGENVD